MNSRTIFDELKEIANNKANELYEKQKQVDELVEQFIHTGNMDPEIMVVNKKLLKLQKEVRQETDELLALQNKIKKNDKTVISLGLPENESIEDFEKDMEQLSKNTLKEIDKDEINENKFIDAKIHTTLKTDIVVLGLRLVIGITFVVHGLMKFVSMGEFTNLLSSINVPLEFAIPIALAELLGGIFLCIGFLSRFSAVIIGLIMLGAIFVVKGALVFTGTNGVELDIIILMCTSLLATFGPGKLSVSNISIKGMIFTRFLH